MMQTMTKSESITYVQSFTLVKNLFRASFSSIAYIRGLFDDEYFVPGRIGGAKFKKLNEANNEEVKNFVAWMEHGVFDALQKKYLETVLLEIYEGPEEGSKEEGQTKNRKLLECFSFGVSYSVEGASFALATPSGSLGDTSAPTELKASIKQETKSVIRTLIELSAKLRPLPPNRVISMKLLYAPGTPADYEPAYFRKANPDDLAWFESKPERISCGNVTTPFHHVSLSVRTARADHLSQPKESGNNDRPDNAPKSILPTQKDNETANGSDKKPKETEPTPPNRCPPKKTTATEIRGRLMDQEARNNKKNVKPKGKIAKSTRPSNQKKAQPVVVLTDSDSDRVVRRPTTRLATNRAKKTALAGNKRTGKEKQGMPNEDSEAVTKRSQRKNKGSDGRKLGSNYAGSDDTTSREDGGAPSVWTMSKKSRKTSEVEEPIHQNIE